MKRIAALLGVLALTTAAWASLAQADSAFKVTGGGQFLVPEEGGAGSTLAFTAQQTGETDEDTGASLAKGQVQYVDRSQDPQVVRHGVVFCLEAVEAGEEGAGYIGGYWQERGNPKADNADLDTFEIYVEDNGEPNQGNDMIFFNNDDTLDCTEDDEHDEEAELNFGRGNVQVHQVEETEE